MKIVVFSPDAGGEETRELAALLRGLVDDAEILSCGFNEVFLDRAPKGMDAAFIFVDNMRALEVVRKLARPHVPMAIISGGPDYAMEGFRLDVRHYIIRPVERADVRAALERLGLFGEEDSG